MLFDRYVAEKEKEDMVRPEAILGVSLRFDWKEGHFVMDGGTPMETERTEALKDWVNLVVRTKRDRYPIYPPNFGAPAQDLIGRKYPKGYSLSELKRQFTESAGYCPAIRDVETMTYEGDDTIKSTMTLKTDQGDSKEVFLFGT